MDEEIVVDARGLRCPLPVLLARRALARHAAARVLLLTDDPASGMDVPYFSEEQQLDCEEREGPVGARAFRLTRRPAQGP